MRADVIKNVSRVVLKFGTGILTDSRKQPDLVQFTQLVHQVANLRKMGKETVVDTSGAVGAGMGALGFDKRPSTLAELQACAAIGQSRLMALYERLFAEHQLSVAQVLLTHDDLEHHERHLNARNTLVTLLQHGVIPIINENDAVSVTELRFGDNDKLSALVACLLPADLLVILTTADGLIQDFGQPTAHLLDVVDQIDPQIEAMAGGTTSATAVGGMTTKIQAAKMTIRSGVPLVIAQGRKVDVLDRILRGDNEGTLFLAQENRLGGRKRWIAFFHHPKGSVWVDDGAKAALQTGGKSLLSPGIIRCEGEFRLGDVIRICDTDGTEFARGITAFDSTRIQGRTSLGSEVIHRDNLVVL